MSRLDRGTGPDVPEARGGVLLPTLRLRWQPVAYPPIEFPNLLPKALREKAQLKEYRVYAREGRTPVDDAASNSQAWSQ